MPVAQEGWREVRGSSEGSQAMWRKEQLPAAENCREETKRKQFSQTLNIYAIIVTEINKYLSYKAVQRTWTSLLCTPSKCEAHLSVASQSQWVYWTKLAMQGRIQELRSPRQTALSSWLSPSLPIANSSGRQQCSVLFRYCSRVAAWKCSSILILQKGCCMLLLHLVSWGQPALVLPFYMIEGSQSLTEFLFEMVVPRRMILGQKEVGEASRGHLVQSKVRITAHLNLITQDLVQSCFKSQPRQIPPRPWTSSSSA